MNKLLFIAVLMIISMAVTARHQSGLTRKKEPPLINILRGFRFVPCGTECMFSSPYGIRTRITTVKGWCPSP